MKQRLEAELAAEAAASRRTAELLATVGQHVVLLEANVAYLKRRTGEVRVDMTTIRAERERVEVRLAAELRRVDKLERLLAESNRAAEVAEQVKRRWEELDKLEGQVLPCVENPPRIGWCVAHRPIPSWAKSTSPFGTKPDSHKPQ